jgi:hypothetical protein
MIRLNEEKSHSGTNETPGACSSGGFCSYLLSFLSAAGLDRRLLLSLSSVQPFADEVCNHTSHDRKNK